MTPAETRCVMTQILMPMRTAGTADGSAGGPS